MDTRPIISDPDYREALRETETLMKSEPDTPEGERLEILAILVEAYERDHYPLDL